MRLKYLSFPINADRFNITEQDLEGLTLAEKVEFISDKMQKAADEQTAAKEGYDKKAVEAFNEVKKYKKLRAAAKAKAANITEKRNRLRKEYRDNLPLIELKLANDDK